MIDKKYVGNDIDIYHGYIDNQQLRINKSSLSDLSKLMLLDGDDMPSYPPRNYLKAIQSIPGTDLVGSIPWYLIIPQKAYKNSLMQFETTLDTILDSKDIDYYQNIFLPTNKVLEVLDKDTNTVYDRFGSITGRLRVVSPGPNILRMKKEDRYNTYRVSRFGADNGTIVTLDYRSLEPRTVCAVNGLSDIPEDIYSHIREVTPGLKKDMSRDSIKQLVMSELYGIPTHEEISDFFKLSEIRKKLFEEYELNDRKYIRNFYGRRISTIDIKPYMLISYFFQSTAVDVAMLGFLEIIKYPEYLDKLDKTIIPMFVLHDALILDVHKSDMHIIPTLCKIGSLDIPKLENTRFYLSSLNWE